MLALSGLGATTTDQMAEMIKEKLILLLQGLQGRNQFRRLQGQYISRLHEWGGNMRCVL